MLPHLTPRPGLPMETLPYWPTVEEPSVLLMIVVILGVPIGFVLLIMVVTKGGEIARSFRVGGRRGPGAFWVNPGHTLPAAVDTSEDDSPYTTGEREALIRAARRAEQASGLDVSVFVGPAEAGRAVDDYAIDLLETLSDPERSVLVFFDPATDALELVTGDEADEQISTADTDRAVAAARTDIEAGFAVRGLITAIEMLSGADVRAGALPTPASAAAAIGH